MKDDAVSGYIHQLRRRYPAFCREHNAEVRHFNNDIFARLFHEHVILGDRSSYEAMLRTMLTGEEQERLQTDEKFTRAWQIFVDLCWTKKQIKRAALILLGIVLLMGIFALFFLALPEFAKDSGPRR